LASAIVLLQSVSLCSVSQSHGHPALDARGPDDARRGGDTAIRG